MLIGSLASVLANVAGHFDSPGLLASISQGLSIALPVYPVSFVLLQQIFLN